MKKVLTISLAVFTLIQCTEPLNIESDVFEEALVVEGHVTTERKVHSIRLTQSAIFGSIFRRGGNIEGVEGASVIVRSDVGENELLRDAGNGFYETSPNFAAVVGRSYSLLIDLPNGQQYISLPERVTPATPVDSVSYTYKEQPTSNDSFDPGIEVTVHLQDSAENRDFYLWKNEGLYEYTTFPSLHELPPPPDPPGLPNVPDPKSCCPVCWRTESFVTPVTESDRLFNGNTYQRPVIFIADDGLRFHNEKYLIKVFQHRISSEAFDFFELIQKQVEIDGDVFDPPPATVTGNIINISDPNDVVIGFFWAADVAIDSVFISSSDLPAVKPQVVVKDDCRETEGTTIDRPSFW